MTASPGQPGAHGSRRSIHKPCYIPDRHILVVKQHQRSLLLWRQPIKGGAQISVARNILLRRFRHFLQRERLGPFFQQLQALPLEYPQQPRTKGIFIPKGGQCFISFEDSTLNGILAVRFVAKHGPGQPEHASLPFTDTAAEPCILHISVSPFFFEASVYKRLARGKMLQGIRFFTSFIEAASVYQHPHLFRKRKDWAAAVRKIFVFVQHTLSHKSILIVIILYLCRKQTVCTAAAVLLCRIRLSDTIESNRPINRNFPRDEV